MSARETCAHGIAFQIAVVAFAVASAFLLSAGPASSQANNDHLIIPGERIGAVNIGMTAGELLSAMGDPTATHLYPESDRVNYTYPGLYVRMNGGRVASASAHGALYTMTGEIMPGSSDLAVRSVLGTPCRTQPLGGGTSTTDLYFASGVVITIDEGGRVRTISVHAVEQLQRWCEGLRQ